MYFHSAGPLSTAKAKAAIGDRRPFAAGARRNCHNVEGFSLKGSLFGIGLHKAGFDGLGLSAYIESFCWTIVAGRKCSNALPFTVFDTSHGQHFGRGIDSDNGCLLASQWQFLHRRSNSSSRHSYTASQIENFQAVALCMICLWAFLCLILAIR